MTNSEAAELQLDVCRALGAARAIAEARESQASVRAAAQIVQLLVKVRDQIELSQFGHEWEEGHGGPTRHRPAA
jgi:hypothetical protein